MPESFDQLAALIRARFSDLSPQFQTGAAFLLDYPDEVAVSSMRKVAQRAQVQPASLVRLSRQFGFPGWNELRALFVARVHDLLVAHQHNLEATAEQNVLVTVEAARLLHRAAHVHVAGFRSCYPVA